MDFGIYTTLHIVVGSFALLRSKHYVYSGVRLPRRSPIFAAVLVFVRRLGGEVDFHGGPGVHEAASAACRCGRDGGGGGGDNLLRRD